MCLTATRATSRIPLTCRPPIFGVRASVTEAFVDVQRIVKNGYSYADSALYASGGYQFDPYYN
jgi:hypothetical protein